MLPKVFCLVSASDDLRLLPALFDVGVAGFQVRDKQLGQRARVVLASAVRHAVPAATIVMNDDVDAALAAGAEGVHLGAQDLPVAAARAMAPGLIIGATCRSRSDVERAAADGADYAGFGPLFATASKQGLPQPLGVAALSDAAGILPLIGIAGVDAGNAASVIAAGAHGVAAIGGIWRAADPVAAAAAIVSAVEAVAA